MNKPILIVLTGPTASGKSALAVSLANRLNTEIISADSRQIYQGIPIATAVPTIEERQNINHHLLEILPLDAYYSAALFKEDAMQIISGLLQQNNVAIVCGGSMLYLDCLVNGIDDLPTVPLEIRENLMNLWKTNGDAWLLQRLKELDPNYYDHVDLKNLKRVFHAIEISMTAGSPYSTLLTNKQSKSHSLPFEVVKICLEGNREQLFKRINDRVIHMIKMGLEEEALRVYPLRHLNSLNTVGLKEMFAMFEGKLQREEAIARIQKNTRVYAKKQSTWHKRDKNLIYLDFQNPIKENVEKIISLLPQKS